MLRQKSDCPPGASAHRILRVGLAIGLALTLAGCGRRTEKSFIAVTIEPQRYFAERIAGNRFEIYTVVPPGQSPETYDATPRQMLRFNQCAAYLLMGSQIGFEQAWIQSILDNNPAMKVFNLSEGFRLISDDNAESDGHHHHHAGGVDPHVWSSVEGARTIAANTFRAFAELDPAGEQLYRENYLRLTDDIDATDSLIRAELAPLGRCAFIIYHPALTYFAREYNLEQLCIELDGKEPSPARLKELVDAVKTHNVKVIFIQQEFDPANARRLAEATGCRLVSINLQAYDWSREMIRLAKALADE